VTTASRSHYRLRSGVGTSVNGYGHLTFGEWVMKGGLYSKAL